MKIFIVHCHPEKTSFNYALTNQAKTTLRGLGHDVDVSDLYEADWNANSGRNNFIMQADNLRFTQQIEEHNAVLNNGFSKEISTEIQKLINCDLLIFQFPLWWGGMPALLKGWIDKVFARGVAYDYGQWYDKGLMKGKRAMVSLTTGGGSNMYQPTGLNGDINLILAPIHYNTLHFCGFDVLPPFISWQGGGATVDERLTTLNSYANYLGNINNLQPLSYPSLDEYDTNTLQLIV